MIIKFNIKHVAGFSNDVVHFYLIRRNQIKKHAKVCMLYHIAVAVLHALINRPTVSNCNRESRRSPTFALVLKGFIVVLNIGPVVLFVEVFLHLRWHQICVGDNNLTEHALRLLRILSFSMKVKRKRR